MERIELTESVSAKVPFKMKWDAMAACRKKGISLSEYIRLALLYVVEHGELPFEVNDTGVRIGRPPQRRY